ILVVAMVCHEAGHAVAMRKAGVEIDEFGIGLPFLPALTIKFYSQYFRWNFTLSPILLGAYVKPTSKGAELMLSLKAEESALIYGAGAWANMCCGYAGLFLASAITGNYAFTWFGWILVCLSPLVFFRKTYCRYVIPVIGGAAFVHIFGMIIYSAFVKHSILGVVGGPATIFGFAKDIKNWSDALNFFSTISLSLALINSMPLSFLDGGRIANGYMARLKNQALINNLTKVGHFLFASLIIIAFICDFVSFF
ncbi:site-2 protease family protein, partial [Candidatus Falkowbacteria bacterium]|nr:site-2 protease family protein [Candidatus Falkowbacteria bacterium]